MINASFFRSAASAADFPDTGLPEIALAGRSNVGKSTLINALVRKTVARTSAAPGKTRLANYYVIQPQSPGSREFYLVDLPGYGYARGGRATAEEFELLTQEYFAPLPGSRRRLAGVFHLIDARHPEMDADNAAHQWLGRTGVAIAIIATKMDKLSQSQAAKSLTILRDGYDTVVIPVSAATGKGLDDIWKQTRTWLR